MNIMTTKKCIYDVYKVRFVHLFNDFYHATTEALIKSYLECQRHSKTQLTKYERPQKKYTNIYARKIIAIEK